MDETHTKLWINVDGVCVLRIQDIQIGQILTRPKATYNFPVVGYDAEQLSEFATTIGGLQPNKET